VVLESALAVALADLSLIARALNHQEES
jgi:hypothetical protein